MASKNSQKIYSENSYYHIYNRGVEKRKIFQDSQDYRVFLSYLKTYLTSKDEKELYEIIGSESATSRQKDLALKKLHLKNYSEELKLLCFALLPNHFHLLVYQSKNVIQRFMNSLGTRYGMYFNRRYKRIGVLFQDVYKAVLVESDEQLLQLSRYIHLNPVVWQNLSPVNWKKTVYPSSIGDYLDRHVNSWIKTETILNYFSREYSSLNYESFLGVSEGEEQIFNLMID